MTSVLPYGRQWVEEDDIRAVVETLRGDWLTQGPKVAEFEAAMAASCGVPFAVAFANGTAALHAAVHAAGAGPGDEVVTCPLSFAASANCAAYVGATPRFADVEDGGFLMDPAALERAMNPRVKAVIPVDLTGHPADLEAVCAVAHAGGALVIEDAAHSLGARYKGTRVGPHCDMAILSFHPVKHITTGEGGMVLTKDRRLYEALSLFRTHGITRPAPEASPGPWYYEMVELGYNYRLSDLQCALGLSQLAKLDRFVARRREIAARYRKALAGHPIIVPLEEKPWAESSYHLFALSIDFGGLGKSRAQAVAELRERGVGSQVHYIPIHLHPFYRSRYGCKPGDFPHAERLSERLLSIPMYPKLTDAEVGRVIDALGEVFGRRAG